MFNSVLSAICKMSLVQYRADALNTIFLAEWYGAIVSAPLFMALIEDFLLVVKQHVWYPKDVIGASDADRLLHQSVTSAWKTVEEVLYHSGAPKSEEGYWLDEKVALCMLVHFINTACGSSVKLKNILRV
jgi:hypothetical protein